MGLGARASATPFYNAGVPTYMTRVQAEAT